MSDKGWICPRCEAVNAPSVLKCTCSPKAAANDLWQQLIEAAKKHPQPVYVPMPYPVYPNQWVPYWGNASPRIGIGDVTYTTNTIGCTTSQNVVASQNLLSENLR